METATTALREDHLAQIARRRFEEPRKGEVLVRLDALEKEERSERLAKAIGQRNRVKAAAQAYTRAATEKVKSLDEEIEQLSAELEYGQHWIPAQTQFEAIADRFAHMSPPPGSSVEPEDEPSVGDLAEASAAAPVETPPTGKKRTRRRASKKPTTAAAN